MFLLSFLHVKIDDDEKFDSELIQRCQTTKLQIVIICPLLIGLESAKVKQRLSQIIKSDRTVGMLLDVKESQILDVHRESKEKTLFSKLINFNLHFYSFSIVQQMAKVRSA